VRGISLISVTN